MLPSSRGAGAGSIHTLPSTTFTGNVRTSSAKGLNVPPLDSSNRAWCQWQVRIPSLTLPAFQGKAHVGTTVVHRVDLPVVKEDGDGVSPTGYHGAAPLFNLGQSPALMCPFVGIFMTLPPFRVGQDCQGYTYFSACS